MQRWNPKVENDLSHKIHFDELFNVPGFLVNCVICAWISYNCEAILICHLHNNFHRLTLKRDFLITSIVMGGLKMTSLPAIMFSSLLTRLDINSCVTPNDEICYFPLCWANSYHNLSRAWSYWESCGLVPPSPCYDWTSGCLSETLQPLKIMRKQNCNMIKTFLYNLFFWYVNLFTYL